MINKKGLKAQKFKNLRRKINGKEIFNNVYEF